MGGRAGAASRVRGHPPMTAQEECSDGLDHDPDAVLCGACGMEHAPGDCDLDPANRPLRSC
jgi:hypothetical protein